MGQSGVTTCSFPAGRCSRDALRCTCGHVASRMGAILAGAYAFSGIGASFRVVSAAA
jgi:hypothetical protein